MTPWTIIGWIILAIAACFALLILLAVFVAWKEAFKKLNRHYKTRDIPPNKGQSWEQNGSDLYIGENHGKHFTIYTAEPNYSLGSRSSWGETPEEWRKRVRNRKLFLKGEY